MLQAFTKLQKKRVTARIFSVEIMNNIPSIDNFLLKPSKTDY